MIAYPCELRLERPKLWSATLPDFPDILETGETQDQALIRLKATLERHLKTLTSEKKLFPEPSTQKLHQNLIQLSFDPIKIQKRFMSVDY